MAVHLSPEQSPATAFDLSAASIECFDSGAPDSVALVLSEKVRAPPH
jgi:hypothetical protein